MEKKEDRINDRVPRYTDEELLNCLKNFCSKNGRIPTKGDLTHNPEYPSFSTYKRRFRTWSRALEKMNEEHMENKETTNDGEQNNVKDAMENRIT